MKEQQCEKQVAPPEEQSWGEQVAPPKARRRSFRNRTMLVGVISFFLTATFLFSTWNTIARVIPIPHIAAHPTPTPSSLHT